MWYQGVVLQGQQTGRAIGFPTVNLDPSIIPVDTKKGVYKAVVKYDGKEYVGALYFGPRLVRNETQDVLEIHIIGLSESLYGKTIQFIIKEYIREVRNLGSFELLKKQLQEDIQKISAITSS